MNYALSSTIHPSGIPLVPVDQFSIPAALMNVPVDATFVTQLAIQSDADISVARHFI